MKKSKKLDKKNIEDILALTPMQEGMLFHYLKDAGSEHSLEKQVYRNATFLKSSGKYRY